MSNRNWKEYNEKLVKRGELLFSLDFLESWDEELKEMNVKPVGNMNFQRNSSYGLSTCALSSIQTDGGLSKKAL